MGLPNVTHELPTKLSACTMKTLLLGLDGATFSVLDRLMGEGIMPFLRRFVASGTRAELLSTPNKITPTAWTSLVTGRSAGNHGIFDFVRTEETESGLYVRLVDSRDIRCETIWSMVSRQKRKVISLNFPVMFPPQPLAGYMIPGFVSGRYLRRAVYPLGLYERLKTLPEFNLGEIAWDMDMEQKSVQTLPQEEYESWIRFHIRREQQWFTLLKYLMQNNACDLTAYLADGADKILHLAWRFIDPAYFPQRPSEWEQKIRELCLEYFRQLDGFIAEVVTMVGPEARVFMVSDHGFGPTWEIFYLNVWLHQHGYLEWGEGGTDLDNSDNIFATRRRAQLLDWQKTVAYAPTPSSNGIRIRVSKGPDQPGIPVESYESFRRELCASLLAFTDQVSGERIVKQIMTREEIFSGSEMPLAPDLMLVLRDHGFISILNAEMPLKQRKEIKGTHRPEGIFIAAGPGLRKGHRLDQLSILDVCPILLYSLGLEIPLNLEGNLPLESFEPSFLKAHPVRAGDEARTVSATAAPDSEGFISQEEEAAVLARLRELGYLE